MERSANCRVEPELIVLRPPTLTQLLVPLTRIGLFPRCELRGINFESQESGESHRLLLFTTPLKESRSTDLMR